MVGERWGEVLGREWQHYVRGPGEGTGHEDFKMESREYRAVHRQSESQRVQAIRVTVCTDNLSHGVHRQSESRRALGIRVAAGQPGALLGLRCRRRLQRQ